MYATVFLYVAVVFGLVESRVHEISINEETSTGTVILDLNSLSSSSITYQFLESSPLLIFNSTTNQISIGKRIDRDVLCPNDESCSNCYLTMKLYDMFHYDILLVKVSIEDLNDNQPIFSSNTYSISLTENNMPGMKIRLSKAEDIDCFRNGVQVYELTYVYENRVIISSINLSEMTNRTTSNQPFYLMYDSQSDLYLVINLSLDREVQNEYIFTIIGNDQKHTISSKLTLTVLDVNDHNPRFSQSTYSVNISQSTPIGTKLLKLIAHDADSEENARIFYSLLSVDGHKIESDDRNEYFQLNTNSGELSLISKLSHLDGKNIFKLIVAASDGSEHAIPALATIYVHIRNSLTASDQSSLTVTFGSNKISQNSSEVFIQENLPNATFIAYIQWESGTIEIEPEENPDRGFFIQQLTNHSLTILTDRSYDRENQSSYQVRLRHGEHFQTFKIVVTDMNDCAPLWNGSLFNIDLDLHFQQSQPMIFTLNATDDDLNSKTGYRKKSSSWPIWVIMRDNQLIINCSLDSNETNNDCWFSVSNGEVWLDIEAYDVDEPKFSSIVQIRLYRSSIFGQNLPFVQISRSLHEEVWLWFKHDYILISVAGLLGVLFVLATILVCLYIRRESREKNSSRMSQVTDDQLSTKQKIIPNSSTTSEQSSSAGSLYGSEKSENITVETSDMFLFSPKRTVLLPQSSDNNLTNKLFHSIQTDLSLLTDPNHGLISNRGTYV